MIVNTTDGGGGEDRYIFESGTTTTFKTDSTKKYVNNEREFILGTFIPKYNGVLKLTVSYTLRSTYSSGADVTVKCIDLIGTIVVSKTWKASSTSSTSTVVFDIPVEAEKTYKIVFVGTSSLDSNSYVTGWNLQGVKTKISADVM